MNSLAVDRHILDNSIVEAVLTFLSKRHLPIFKFWIDGKSIPKYASIGNHCDFIYIMTLLGIEDKIQNRSIITFCDLLKKFDFQLFNPTGDYPLSAHGCAYVFAALNLMPEDRSYLYDRVLAGRSLNLDRVVDRHTFRPLFPGRWAHHSWRVSHWLGGTSSALLSLARSGTIYAEDCQRMFDWVHAGRSGYIDLNTGLIRAYQSRLIQRIFQRFYALRHAPALGNLGGIAHILWIDHVIDSPYIAGSEIYDAASREFARHDPFMEVEPYCLDFDIVQIVRTCRDRKVGARDSDRSRAREMIRSICDFLISGTSDSYTLHKLPGALATIHECAMIEPSPALVRSPIDIIKRAHWL